MLPALALSGPPKPYQGLNYDNVVTVRNQDVALTTIKTPQGKQFLATNTASTPVISVPDTQTFTLHSAFVAINVLTDNSLLIPAQTGTVLFTGTRPDGSTVEEKVEYTPTGKDVVIENGIVIAGTAYLQEVKFEKLSGITTLVVTVQEGSSAIDIGGTAVCNTLLALGIDLNSAFNGLNLDGFKYDVVEWYGKPPADGQKW